MGNCYRSETGQSLSSMFYNHNQFTYWLLWNFQSLICYKQRATCLDSSRVQVKGNRDTTGAYGVRCVFLQKREALTVED